jgi:GT2 family glycosyltransferase
VVSVPAARGLGFNRNVALAEAHGSVIVFLDDDCVPCDGWLETLLAPLSDPAVDGVMGAVRLTPSSRFGELVGALGYPAGGSVGFPVMFPVDAAGFTHHFSTLNAALRIAPVRALGGFDETMRWGCEDSELACRARGAGLRVRFEPDAVVTHPVREDLAGLTRWLFCRGRAAYQLTRRAPGDGRIGLRLRSYRQIVRMHRGQWRVVPIVALLGYSTTLLSLGMGWEWLAGGAGRRVPDAEG